MTSLNSLSENTVDADLTTVFYDDDAPDVPPLPAGVHIMDTFSPDDIPLPPEPPCSTTDESRASAQPQQLVRRTTKELASHSTISFGFKNKASSALPGQSIFNEEEEAQRRALNFPKRRKVLPKKGPTLSFVPKSTEREEKKEEKEEELYPMQPTPGDEAARAPLKPHFKKMTFVQATDNLGVVTPAAASATPEPVYGPANKPDLLQFVKVRVRGAARSPCSIVLLQSCCLCILQLNISVLFLFLNRVASRRTLGNG